MHGTFLVNPWTHRYETFFSDCLWRIRQGIHLIKTTVMKTELIIWFKCLQGVEIPLLWNWRIEESRTGHKETVCEQTRRYHGTHLPIHDLLAVRTGHWIHKWQLWVFYGAVSLTETSNCRALAGLKSILSLEWAWTADASEQAGTS